ncbi:GNAT family N-acetyltransferase [Halobaculum sp. CBA1158]|uniref:GNAT family N-acetyltransferase n=1 Tax=Halobaculum sp. CBA1158 TaxID=2904243 RepID=UPI001F2757A6|nr:GNAT family protein [Halobaculum sp. CBA1158]UIO99704.1 GNAT family N-acetyltransferase [Halobaculum sp. CBA1158]
MPGPVFLADERVALRTVESEDEPFLHEHRNRASLRDPLGEFEPLTAEDVAEYREEVVRGDDGLTLAICVDGDPVGLCFLFDEDARRGVAEVGYWLAPDAKGNGYATAAAGLLCDHAFDERGHHRLTARVYEGNDASTAVLERLGFAEEGRLRENAVRDGERRDTLRYGLLAREWDRES